MRLKNDTPDIQPIAPDAIALDESLRLQHSRHAYLTKRRVRAALARLVRKHVGGVPQDLAHHRTGASSDTFQVNLLGCGTLLRLPQAGSAAMFPAEAVRNEAAALRYLQANTGIPVPFVHGLGTAAQQQGLAELPPGPFLIVEHITHTGTLADLLSMPRLEDGDDEVYRAAVLDPNVDLDTLRAVYAEMATVLLHLSRASFASIGALAQTNTAYSYSKEDDEEQVWDIQHRPLTLQMNQLVRLGTLPRTALPSPSATFPTSSAYFQHLAALHHAHLSSQRNSPTTGASLRRMFVARRLFQRLARDDRLGSPLLRFGPFPLWCDELSPQHALTNGDGRVAAVVDWKHAYAAPAEFAHAPPWWLLLCRPESFPGGLAAWEAAYAPRLDLFLRVLRARQDAAIADGWLLPDQERRLSERMRASWASGDFWLAYAARESFAFDWVYWHKLDQRFFGPLPKGVAPGEAWRERLHLLAEADVQEMEALVASKVAETGTGELRWEPDEVWPPVEGQGSVEGADGHGE